jgi:4-amino-4-deoxy-L-arabinose transferase-like glycosyltransferase
MGGLSATARAARARRREGPIQPDRPLLLVDALLVALPAVLALILHLSFLITDPLNYDEAFNLQVALNVARGNGYQTWYNAPTPFDVRITTGPTILIPAAYVLKVLPVTRIAGRLVMSVFFVVFLITLYRVGKRLAPGHHRQFFCASIIFLVALPSFGFLSAAVLGELPSLTSCLLAFLTVSRAERAGTWLLAGCYLGLAALTKLTAAMCLPVLLIASALACWREGALKMLSSVVLCAAGCMLPIVAWHTYKASVLGWSRYVSLFSESLHFVQTHGSGADQATLAGLLPRMETNLSVLSDTLHRPPAAIAVGLVVVLIGAGWLLLRSERNPLGFAILVSAALLLGWFLAVSDWKFYRHAFPGYCFLALVGAYLMAVGAASLGRARRTEQAIAAAGILAAFACIPVGSGWLAAGERVRRPSADFLALQRDPQEHLASLVRQIHEREPQATFWGYGWSQAPDISFLADVPFHDMAVVQRVDRGPYYFVTGLNIEPPEIPEIAKRYCDSQLFSQGFFRLCHLRTRRQ